MITVKRETLSVYQAGDLQAHCTNQRNEIDLFSKDLALLVSQITFSTFCLPTLLTKLIYLIWACHDYYL